MSHAAVNDFIEKIEWIHEVEAGDFRRKLGLYLLRLEQKVPAGEQTPAFKKMAASIRQNYIYCPSDDLEKNREEILELARKFVSN